jgi:hypothetical protein
MSRYADKHHRKADCRIPNCPYPGSRLAMVNREPCWFCEAHYQDRQHDTTR